MKDQTMSPQKQLKRAMGDVSTMLSGGYDLSRPLYQRMLEDYLPLLEQNTDKPEVAALLNRVTDELAKTPLRKKQETLAPASMLSDKNAHLVSGNRIGWGSR